MTAQPVFYYPLNGSLAEAGGNAAPLSPWPNGVGQTGTFTSRPMPPDACGGVGVLAGYAYPDDAGLGFVWPVGTPGCAYSLQWTWICDAITGYVRVLSFIHTDDSGLYLESQGANVGRAISWHLAPLIPGFCPPSLTALSPNSAFQAGSVYQMVLTRDCAGALRLYANGTLLGTMNDAALKFLPQGTPARLVLFRDTAYSPACYPFGFPGEASPGFISDLRIYDYPLTAAEVAGEWATFCPVVLAPLQLQWKGAVTAAGHQLCWEAPAAGEVLGWELYRQAGGARPEPELLGQWPETGTAICHLHRPASPGRQRYFLRWTTASGARGESAPLVLGPMPPAVQVVARGAGIWEIDGGSHTQPAVEVYDLSGRQVPVFLTPIGPGRVRMALPGAGLWSLRVRTATAVHVQQVRGE